MMVYGSHSRNQDGFSNFKNWINLIYYLVPLFYNITFNNKDITLFILKRKFSKIDLIELYDEVVMILTNVATW